MFLRESEKYICTVLDIMKEYLYIIIESHCVKNFKKEKLKPADLPLANSKTEKNN